METPKASKPSKPSKLKKFFIFIGIFIILCFIGIFIYAMKVHSLQEEVDAKLAALKSRGIILNLQEFQNWYEGRPIKANAAPILKKAGELYDAYKEKLEQTDPEPLDGLPLLGYETITMPKAYEPLPPEMKQKIEKYLAGAENYMRILHQAATIPECRYELDFTLGFAMLLPHLSYVRTACQMLTLEAMLYIEDQKIDEALQSIQTACYIAETLHEEPILISQLVRIANQKTILTNCIERLLLRCKLSPDQLRQLAKAVQQKPGSKLAATFYVELLAGLTAFDMLQSKGEIPESMQTVPAVARWIYYGSGLWHKDMMCYIDTISLYASTLENPPEKWRQATQTAQYPEILENYIVCRLLLPALDKLYLKELSRLSYHSIVQTVIAIERFKNDYNRLPENLSQLVPQYIAQVPLDFLDTATQPTPIKYRIVPNGYLVYSVAEDGEDNQGSKELWTYEELIEESNRIDKYPKDMVFEMAKP